MRIISDIDKILTVAEQGSISKAAKKLGISQSALSRAVQAAEETVGRELFVRTADGAELTEAGKICVNHFWQMKEAEGELYRGLDYLRSSSYRLNIALPLNISFSAIKELEAKIHHKYPDAEVHFYNVFANKVPQGILSGKYDMAISWDEVEDDPRFHFEKIYEDHLLLLVPEGGPAVRFHRTEINGLTADIVDVQDISGLNFVLQDEGTSIRETIDLLVNKYRIRLNNRLSVSNSMMAIKAAEEGLGCALVMGAYAAYISEEKKLKRYVLNDNGGEEVGLITLAEKELTPLEKYTAQVIREFLEERNRKYAVPVGRRGP